MSVYWEAEAGFDWRRYVREHGGSLAYKSSFRKDEYLAPCPDCGKEKLAINVRARAWRCFVCGDGGRDATSLVVKVQQVPWYQAVQFVLNGARRTIGSVSELVGSLVEEETRRDRNWVPAQRVYPESYVPFQQSAEAISYLKHRQISDEAAFGMRLGYCSVGRFSRRLLFPVFDFTGGLIFYQGRAVYEGARVKTLSVSTDASMGQAGANDVLLNLSMVAGRYRSVLLVEGPVDCAHAWPDAVATFGKHLSAYQIELLMRAGIRDVDLCYDADAAEDMRRLAPRLSDIFNVRIVQLPAGCDPGDLTKEEIEHYRAAAPVWNTGSRLRFLTASLRR